MAIIINIDVMLAKRKMSVTELADKVGITMANISILKNGKAKAIRSRNLGSNLQSVGVPAWNIKNKNRYFGDIKKTCLISQMTTSPR
jgi:putative transcriptional regulator